MNWFHLNFFRYQRGNRSLADNLDAPRQPKVPSLSGGLTLTEDDDEEYDIPEEMEDVIGKTLRYSRVLYFTKYEGTWSKVIVCHFRAFAKRTSGSKYNSEVVSSKRVRVCSVVKYFETKSLQINILYFEVYLETIIAQWM